MMNRSHPSVSPSIQSLRANVEPLAFKPCSNTTPKRSERRRDSVIVDYQWVSPSLSSSTLFFLRLNHPICPVFRIFPPWIELVVGSFSALIASHLLSTYNLLIIIPHLLIFVLSRRDETCWIFSQAYAVRVYIRDVWVLTHH